jgi:hypothetical protein
MDKIVAGAIAVMLGLVAADVRAMGIPPDCLETLEGDAQRWTECTEAFDRRDARCKMRSAHMSETMQRCASKGYSQEEINAAMASGAAGARGYLPHDSDIVPEAPAPRPERGPIPGLRKPAEG